MHVVENVYFLCLAICSNAIITLNSSQQQDNHIFSLPLDSYDKKRWSEPTNTGYAI